MKTKTTFSKAARRSAREIANDIDAFAADLAQRISNMSEPERLIAIQIVNHLDYVIGVEVPIVTNQHQFN